MSDYKKVLSKKKEEAKKLMNGEELKKCNAAIHTASIASGAAGVIPIPVMDAVPITAVQITMVLALGKIFEQNVTEAAAKGLIGAAASTLVGRSLVKFIPIVGWGVSAAVAAVVTEVIGWTIAVDFAKNARKDQKYYQSVPDESIEIEDKIKELNETADMFLNAENGATDDYLNREKLDKLLKDIENILDVIKDDDPLRDKYDKLSDIYFS